jgi:hypothetical protein
MGPMGLVGPQGVKGDVGPQGAAGVAGPTGPQGLAGGLGPKGDIGPPGRQGDTGAAGPQGIAGQSGPMGPQGPMGPAGASGTGTGGANVVAFADSEFTQQYLGAGSPFATTVATLDLPPGSWVIVGKAMASAFAQSATAEARCMLASGFGGTGPTLDRHTVAMAMDVHNTVTVAAPFTVQGSAEGHIELQCRTLDATDGMIENAQLWAVQVGTLTSTVATTNAPF